MLYYIKFSMLDDPSISQTHKNLPNTCALSELKKTSVVQGN